jgi:hypothetical protein
MLTDTNNPTGNKFSRPFQSEDREYVKDNKSYIFTDTTGICASDMFDENTANFLQSNFLKTRITSYNLIIHLIRLGPINTVQLTRYINHYETNQRRMCGV